mmetsp:Transcript_10432/g.23655  ORF Transcript_10432/g.23655 Transcript_10432/m.23655 type:complete len:207 (-) Transcript_10432:401-1021(-)
MGLTITPQQREGFHRHYASGSAMLPALVSCSPSNPSTSEVAVPTSTDRHSSKEVTLMCPSSMQNCFNASRHCWTRYFHCRLLTVRSDGSGVSGSPPSMAATLLDSRNHLYSRLSLPTTMALCLALRRCIHSSSVASGNSEAFAGFSGSAMLPCGATTGESACSTAGLRLFPRLRDTPCCEGPFSGVEVSCAESTFHSTACAVAVVA